MARTKITARKNVKTNKDKDKGTASKKTTASSVDVSKVSTKKTHRFKSGTVAKRDIRRLQKSTEPIFATGPFTRWVRKKSENFKSDLRFSKEAISNLRESEESNLIKVLHVAKLFAKHLNKTTVKEKDLVFIGENFLGIDKGELENKDNGVFKESKFIIESTSTKN